MTYEQRIQAGAAAIRAVAQDGRAGDYRAMAEAALTAAGVAEMAAEIARLHGSIAVEKQWRKDANDRAEELAARLAEVTGQAA